MKNLGWASKEEKLHQEGKFLHRGNLSVTMLKDYFDINILIINIFSWDSGIYWINTKMKQLATCDEDIIRRDRVRVSLKNWMILKAGVGRKQNTKYNKMALKTKAAPKKRSRLTSRESGSITAIKQGARESPSGIKHTVLVN